MARPRDVTDAEFEQEVLKGGQPVGQIFGARPKAELKRDLEKALA